MPYGVPKIGVLQLGGVWISLAAYGSAWRQIRISVLQLGGFSYYALAAFLRYYSLAAFSGIRGTSAWRQILDEADVLQLGGNPAEPW